MVLQCCGQAVRLLCNTLQPNSRASESDDMVAKETWYYIKTQK